MGGESTKSGDRGGNSKFLYLTVTSSTFQDSGIMKRLAREKGLTALSEIRSGREAISHIREVRENNFPDWKKRERESIFQRADCPSKGHT